MSVFQASRQQRRSHLLKTILDRRSASTYGLVLLTGIGVVGHTQVLPNLLLVLIVVFVVVYEFQKRLDQGVPLLQLTAMIAVLQWLLGPALAYNSEYEYGKYRMYVDESRYFEYALPATTLYVVVMLAIGASIRQKELLGQLDRSNFVKIGFFLNFIAFVASIAATRAGGGLQFALFLVSQARYVGAIYFLFSRHPLRLLLAAGSLSFLFIASLSVGMFHDLLLWMAVIFCYWFAQRKWDFRAKVMALTATGLLLFAIQVVKQDYRSLVRRGEQPSIVQMMISYLSPSGQAWEDNAIANAIIRLNQGWIISAVLDYVPAEEPYAEGETLKDAIVSAFMPRVLAPDKKQAGGRENFRRFTGLPIGKDTSMGISPLGEAYANFGTTGGILLMMGFGALFALLFKFALKFVAGRPAFFFWLPMVFYQSIKAETEFLVVLNQLSKGTVIALVLYYFTDLNFPVRFKRIVLQSVPLPVPRRRLVSSSSPGTTAH
jgi:hypothetical protein